MRLVAQPVPSLLGRRAVVAQPVGLDDEAEVRPVEVDFELIHPLAGQRDGQAGLGASGRKRRSSSSLVSRKVRRSRIWRSLATPGSPARSSSARRSSRRVHEVVFVRLVDRPLEPAPVEAEREVDQGLDRGRDGDAVLDGRVARAKGRAAMNRRPGRSVWERLGRESSTTARSLGSDAPERRRAGVTEHRPVAAGEHGSHPAAVSVTCWTAHRIHAAVQRWSRPVADPVMDRVRLNPTSKLIAGHDPVLSAGQIPRLPAPSARAPTAARRTTRRI